MQTVRFITLAVLLLALFIVIVALIGSLSDNLDQKKALMQHNTALQQELNRTKQLLSFHISCQKPVMQCPIQITRLQCTQYD